MRFSSLEGIRSDPSCARFDEERSVTMQEAQIPADRLTVLLPAGVALAIERAAIQARVTPSKLMQRAMADGLRSWGLQLSSSALPTG